MGQIILDVHHTTTGRSYFTKFYVSKDTTSSQILISYVASERLGILHLFLPNKTRTAQIDTITTQPKLQKHYIFSTTNMVFPLFRTIHHRTNATRSHSNSLPTTMIPKFLNTALLKLSLKTNILEPNIDAAKDITPLMGTFSRSFDIYRQHAQLLHHRNRPHHKTCTTRRRKVPTQPQSKTEGSFKRWSLTGYPAA